jgi:hypothetical protein
MAVRSFFCAVDDLLRVESWREIPVRTLSIKVGSSSRKTARGTFLPPPVSGKKVLNVSSQTTIAASDGIYPFGWTSCSTGRAPTSASDLETHLPAMDRQNFMHVEK